jgi:hypothetical protein
MSLRSRIRELRTYAEVANDERKVRLRTGQLSDLRDRVAVPAQEFPALTDGLAEIRQLKVEIPATLDQDAIQLADGLRALAAELPGMALDANLDLARFQVRSAEKFAAELHGFISTSWHQLVRQPLPPINEDLLDALSDSGVDVEAIRDALENAHVQLLAIGNRAIPREGDVAKHSAAFDSMRACGEQIRRVVDPDIAEGILGAQEESGMPLAWFTTERLQTLSDLGIIDRFRVRLR